MNALDLAIIAVVALSGLFAFMRGFVKEALSIAAWLGAFFVALYGYPYAQPFAERFLPRGPVAGIAAAVSIFVMALILLTLLTSRLSRRVQDSSLSALDRTFGLIFGLVRGVVLVSLAYLALAWVLPPSEPQPSWMAEARTLPLLRNGAETLRRLAPPQLRERATSAVARTQNTVEQEVDGAIRAYSAPRLRPAPQGAGAPVYTPDDRRDLNRLFQQNAQ